MLDSFTISTNIKYNDFKFKRFLIDLSAVNRSTGSFSQLKALQRVYFVELNKTTAGLTNFVFRISSISFISIINLNTPFKIIIFHIVQVNTSFLLYFIDIDKLEVFFNNFTN